MNRDWERELGCLFACFLRWSLGTLALAAVTRAAPAEFDLVIYGGTSAAVSAAVAAKMTGKTVVIVCPDRHLGGMTSGGLGWTDTGNKATIGGLARQFYHAIWKYYQQPSVWRYQSFVEFRENARAAAYVNDAEQTMWAFEPHVAEQIFDDWVRQFAIPVYRDEWLDRAKGVAKQGGRIRSIRMLSGSVFSGKMFIDATYEGDLMAAAGVEYRVGREANRVYGEQWNGIQLGVLAHGNHFGNLKISAYAVPGDPRSGVVPRVSTEPPGAYGEGDHKIQAYCFRLCLTEVPTNRVAFARPEGYDPGQYELLLRLYGAGRTGTSAGGSRLPNLKTDTNNAGPFSTDDVGMNYEYPDASYERRRDIVREHENYEKGLFYFAANDPRVPAEVRNRLSTWGLARDEFQDNGHWPRQLYVREARRMVGVLVMTEHEILKRRPAPDSIGMGSYTIDSHPVQRYITPEGYVQNEGDVGASVNGAYPIAYEALIPRKAQCENLLVPVCLSSSHIAYGSIRMEPVFMILGQSAATAAALAIETGQAVQDLEYRRLRDRLLADGQVLSLAASPRTAPDHP